MSEIDMLLESCEGIRCESEQKRHQFFKEGDIVVPPGVYIKINGTATKGTIGRLVDIEVKTYGEKYPGSSRLGTDNEIATYDTTLIYEVDGRKQKGRIAYHHANILVGEHETKYVRNIKKHDKKKVKNPVNKFKQEMKRGDWVVGVKPGKVLGIGRITRWTNHNVWATTGEDLDDKSKEFKFDSIQQTFTMPNDEHVALLTWAVMKGWNGK